MIRLLLGQKALTVGQLRAKLADCPDDRLVVVQDPEGYEYVALTGVATETPIRVRRSVQRDKWTDEWQEELEECVVIEGRDA